MKNKYDFQVGDIIIERDSRFLDKPMEIIYTILEVRPMLELRSTNEIPNDVILKLNVNAADIILMIRDISGGVKDKYIFGYQTWASVQVEVIKIRGDKMFKWSNKDNKWITSRRKNGA